MQHREEDLQLAVAKWLFMQYPKLLWNHTPLGGARPKRRVKTSKGWRMVSTDGQRLALMGSRPGMPDIMIYQPIFYHNMKMMYCGLAIELKIVYPDGTKGKLSNDQKKCLDLLEKAKWKTAVCYDFDEVAKIVQEYLG